MRRSSRHLSVLLLAWASASCAGRSVRDGDGSGGTGGASAGGGRGGSAGDSAARCDEPADCVLVPRGCCAPCEPVALDDYLAVNAAYAGELARAPQCGDVACAPCAPASSEVRRWLGVTCRDGLCVGFDARAETFTACESSADCRVRAGLDCCQGCVRDDRRAVAVSDEAQLRALVCASDGQSCDDCAPNFAPDLEANCSLGRCGTNFRGGN